MYAALAFAVQAGVFQQGFQQLDAGAKAQWVAQTGGVFIQLLYAFTMVVQLGTATTAFVSHSNRVATLLDALDRRSPRDTPPDMLPLVRREASARDRAVLSYGDALSIENLVLHPSATCRVGPVSLTVRPSEWVLLTGAAGAGKSSVVRALCGLITPESGLLRVPRGTMFVPQAGYVPRGSVSLRELVVYPRATTCGPDGTARVEHALRAVGWRGGDAVDEPREWDALSPGERQVISAARVVARAPLFAVLDEPTCSLDGESERQVLAGLRKCGVAVLLIGHGEALWGACDRVVTVGGDEGVVQGLQE